MQLPSFSIITVSFNSGRTIGQTIESVLSQTLSNVEYLIIDGESTDDTLQIVNDFGKKISHIVSEPDKGIYHAMNKGILLASGEIIGILNSDDLYAYPGYLEDVARLFAETRADMVYSDLVYVDRNNERVIREWKSGYYTPGDFKKGWMPPHPTVFVQRKVYEQAGLFNLDLKSSSDYEILLRFFEKHRFKAAYLPKTGVRMRVGGRSNATLKTRLKANREDYLAWKINGLKPWPFTRILKPLRKIPQFFISGKNSG